MKVKLCRACKGAKQLLGLGMMSMEKCNSCKGVGYVPDIDEQEMDALLDASRPAIVDVDDKPIKVRDDNDGKQPKSRKAKKV